MGTVCLKGQYVSNDTPNTIALRRAASCGDTKRLEFFIRKGADVNTADSFGHTALILAAQSGYDNCVRKLIHAGANVNKSDRFGHTALMRAVKNSNDRCVDLLIQAGANVNKADIYGYTALIKSTQKCDDNGTNISHKLLQAAADVNIMNMYGDTALFTALSEGNYRCVCALIQSGAEVNATKENGNTTLMAAVEPLEIQFKKDKELKSKIKCVKLLLSAGAHLNKTNDKRQNCLEFYMSKHERIDSDVFMLLFAAGEAIDSTSIEGIMWDENNNNLSVDVTDSLQTGTQKDLSLKNTCREAIRKHLVVLDPHEHLFDRVPRLGLPSLITDYLLYGMTLE